MVYFSLDMLSTPFNLQSIRMAALCETPLAVSYQYRTEVLLPPTTAQRFPKVTNSME